MGTGYSVQHTYASVGAWTATLSLVLAGGLGTLSCGTQPIQVNGTGGPLSVDAGPDKTINQGESATLEATASGGVGPYAYAWVPAQYSWTPASTISDPAVLRPSVNPDGTATYVLTVTDSQGQRAADEVRVNVFASQLEQYGITWTFDRPYQVGRFVIGDWWVVAPVTVTGISRPHGVPGRDGSEINPVGTAQAYDDRGGFYNGGKDVSLSLPLNMAAGNSLVSSISWESGEPGCPPLTGGKPRPVLKVVCVLTALGSIPPADTFRPAAYGATKRLLRASDLRWDRLPRLPLVAGAPTPASLEGAFEKFRLDQVGSYSSVEFLHPSEAMPWYGRDSAVQVGNAALSLCLAYPDEQKMRLLAMLVQHGIDLHGAVASGTRWPANGGHASGRKLPILFAGLLLDDAAMLAVGSDYPANTNTFGEDAQTFYVTQADVDRVNHVEVTGVCQGASGTTIVLQTNPEGYANHEADLNGLRIRITGGTGSGQVRTINSYSRASRTATISPAWTTLPDGTSTYRVLSYEAADIGMPEWGIRHASEPVGDNPSWQAGYRQCCTANGWAGHVLAARILGLRPFWNHDALFDYTDRYMVTETAQLPGPFTLAMWGAYRSQY